MGRWKMGRRERNKKTIKGKRKRKMETGERSRRKGERGGKERDKSKEEEKGFKKKLEENPTDVALFRPFLHQFLNLLPSTFDT